MDHPAPPGRLGWLHAVVLGTLGVGGLTDVLDGVDLVALLGAWAGTAAVFRLARPAASG